MISKEDLAKELDGIEYEDLLTRDRQSWDTAKNARLVVVHGYSDDNIEFCGAIYDELPAWEGVTVLFTKRGKRIDSDDLEAIKAIEEKLDIKIPLPLNRITAVWCPKNENGEVIQSWSFITEIPHTTFCVMKESKLGQTAIIFSIDDLT